MKRVLLLFWVIFLLSGYMAYSQPLDELLKDYRFEERIKGPTHKRSKLLEVKVDEHNNYLAMTFSATSYRYIHLYIYRLYTWKPVQELRIQAKRIELYNSTFDADGKYFYANTDVYKNEFIKIDLKSGDITNVACQEVPGNGCRPLEVRQYETTKFTVGENYVIFQDDKLANYVRIFVRKELYKVQNEEDGIPDFLKDNNAEDEEKTPTINSNFYTVWIEPKDLTDLKEYGYLKVKKFDLLINNELAKTFEFNKHNTTTIVLPETALDKIEQEGEWKLNELRVAVKK